MNTTALIAGLCGISLGQQVARFAFRKYLRATRDHVKLLKEQVRAIRSYADASAETAKQWKVVADLAQAEARSQRHEREVAERRLTLVRDNMHKEREA